jgi:hypothetical protein
MPPKTRKIDVQSTANFDSNLADIDHFLSVVDAPQAYDLLLDELLETVIPNLERFPEMGRPFFNRALRSIETTNAVDRLRERLGALTADPAALREYIMADYLLLYAQIEQIVYLLAIKHHRQLSFDFDAHGIEQ